MVRFTALSALMYLVCLPATGQVKMQRNEIVYLRAPASILIKETKSRRGLVTLDYYVYTAMVDTSDSESNINSHPDWKSDGFPSFIELRVDKVRQVKNKNQTVVELKDSEDTRYDFTLVGDAPSLFSRIVCSKQGMDQARKEAYAALGAKFFTGPLADLSADKKEALLIFANVTAHGTTISSTTFKEKLYLEVDMGDGKTRYNDLKLNQSQRIATVIQNDLLVILKAFSKPVQDVPALYGIKLNLGVRHKSFLDEYAPDQIDKLEIYAPSSLIRQFASADITSQQLIDGSIIIVNDNRIQVPLSGP